MSETAARLEQIEAGGFQWLVRPGTSDWSSIKEVAVRRAYFTRSFHPEAGERWLDAGANIGAFSVVCAAAGADVVAYEPWPENAELARANLRLNGLGGRVRERAITHTPGVFRLGLARQPWRHSLLREGGEGHPVRSIAFAEAVDGMDAAKLDIEGAELAILETAEFPERLRKLTFEWHFDYAPETDRYRAVLDRLRARFAEVKGRRLPAGELYRWYPPALLVRCQR